MERPILLMQLREECCEAEKNKQTKPNDQLLATIKVVDSLGSNDKNLIKHKALCGIIFKIHYKGTGSVSYFYMYICI